MEKNLVNELNKKRIRGFFLGAFLPIVLLLIVGFYGFCFDMPWMVVENSFAGAPTSYFGVIWVYLISQSHYHVFFCLSANMLTVWFLTSKNKNTIANGIVIPTVIYAVLLIVVRLI